MMSNVLVGTTSWTEKTLLDSGRFYPPEVKNAEQRLRFYASCFPVVEVDSTYYGMPAERNASLWAERTPAGFRFDVKAFRVFTHHQTSPSALPRDLRMALGSPEKKNIYYSELPEPIREELWLRFASALRPLRESGKLGAVLFQFAPWFVRRPEHLDYLRELRERLPGHRIAVEFRNRSWFSERHTQEVLDFERSMGFVHVIVDEPQGFSGSIPSIWIATSRDLAIVRLHGRNEATWQRKGLVSAAERFDYLYSEDELSEFVPEIHDLETETGEIHVLFNNCYRDNAQRNALELRNMLR